MLDPLLWVKNNFDDIEASFNLIKNQEYYFSIKQSKFILITNEKENINNEDDIQKFKYDYDKIKEDENNEDDNIIKFKYDLENIPYSCHKNENFIYEKIKSML